MTSIFDCIIVGSGIAGMTSAIYLKRAGKRVLLLEKSAPGGQINMSPAVENYPGFLNIEGAILASNIFEQTQKLNIDYKYGNVLNIKKEEKNFTVTTDIESYETASIIIATGRKVEKLNLNCEEELIGKGISYCAICDGNFFKGKNVSIYGNDYKVLEEAIYLANICENVNIICEKDKFENNTTLLETINEYKNITIYFNSKIIELIKDNGLLSGIKIKKTPEKIINCECLFVGNNLVPDLNFLSDIKKDNGYIIVDKNMNTNIKGVFACGDVIKKDVYQLTTAIGEAAISANSVLTYLTGGEK